MALELFVALTLCQNSWPLVSRHGLLAWILWQHLLLVTQDFAVDAGDSVSVGVITPEFDEPLFFAIEIVFVMLTILPWLLP